MKTQRQNVQIAIVCAFFASLCLAACDSSQTNPLNQKPAPNTHDAAAEQVGYPHYDAGTPISHPDAATLLITDVSDLPDQKPETSIPDTAAVQTDLPVDLADPTIDRRDAAPATAADAAIIPDQKIESALPDAPVEQTGYQPDAAITPISDHDAAPLLIADAPNDPNLNSNDPQNQRSDDVSPAVGDVFYPAETADTSQSNDSVMLQADTSPDTAVANHDAAAPKCPVYVDVNSASTGAETGSPFSPWKTIQAAINNPTTCDTIIVKRGTYHESISCGYSSIKTIKSEEGASVTIIDRSNSTDQPNGITMNYCSALTIDGFTIANAGVGIYFETGPYPTIIQHNIFLHNAQGIIVVYTGDAPIIIRNNIIIGDPKATAGPYVGTGINVAQTGGLRQIENNLIIGNIGESSTSAGVFIDNWSTGYVQNNIIADGYNGILRYYDYNTTIIQYNCLFGNTNDYGESAAAGTGDIHTDPLFVSTIDGGVGATTDFHLAPSSPCRNTGNPDPSFNNPDGTRNDIGPYGGPYGAW